MARLGKIAGVSWEKIISKRWFASLLLLAFSVHMTSCSSTGSNKILYPTYTEAQAQPFRFGQYEKVAQSFAEPAKTTGPDRLLFLLDRSLALFEQAKYLESLNELRDAEKLLQIQNYDAQAELRATSIRNTQRKLYRGDPHESVLLSVYQSLNYAFLGNEEAAIHEIRRGAHKLGRLNTEKKDNYSYTVDAFFHYWAAVLYERQGLWQEAYVDYKRATQGMASAKFLQNDLLRMAAKLDSDTDIARWRGAYGLQELDVLEAYRSLRDYGSVVVLWQNGFHAAKKPHPEFSELPIYEAVENQDVRAKLYVDGKEVGFSAEALNLDNLAFTDSARREALYQSDKAKGFPLRRQKKILNAKRRAGYRDGGADSVDRQTEFLTADLRRWTTLPQSFHLLRANLPVGAHRIYLRLQHKNGRWGPIRDLGEVQIQKAGDVRLLSYHSFNDSAGNKR